MFFGSSFTVADLTGVGKFFSKGPLPTLASALSYEPSPELPERVGQGWVSASSAKTESLRYCWLPWRLTQPLSSLTRAPLLLHSARQSSHPYWVPMTHVPAGLLLLYTSCFSKSSSPWCFHASCQSLWALPCGDKALRGKSPVSLSQWRLSCTGNLKHLGLLRTLRNDAGFCPQWQVFACRHHRLHSSSLVWGCVPGFPSGCLNHQYPVSTVPSF